MKTIVCYPMRALVRAFMPKECDTLAVEDDKEFYFQVARYQPSVVVLFQEAFNQPVWEWVPTLASHLSQEVCKVIIPLHKDEQLVQEIVARKQVPKTYVLSANMSYEEIQQELRLLLGLATEPSPSFLVRETRPSYGDEERTRGVDGRGRIVALISAGGAGLTTFCINYPLLSAKEHPKKRIAVIDMNRAKPDLTHFFQLESYQLARYRPDLLDVRAALQRNWLASFVQSEYAANLFYSNATLPWESYEMSTLLAVLRQSFDLVYIDWGFAASETEGFRRLLVEADYTLLFTRSDPFSLGFVGHFSRKHIKWNIKQQIVVSPYDKEGMSLRRISETLGAPVVGTVPVLSVNRLHQSLLSRSIVIQEMFPPKLYINGLVAFLECEKKWEGAM